ncbi:CDP-diacylglycerol--glycerol-3-phosphate 3-phosphatidyltransferase [Opitutaceae bacterium TAV4]|uniref:CDP-diacylglycerol--glycerol-3-phosphate 3-phosphatidyltransferase n=1 Tax=Geminisphaera colitermitum TaxID=1148786 RepID=UPI000158CF65|nr:CDP-diacylglycerol--glycerol-3-phosphate 3-phosphatidyltransferase [Geminisphaera colitermitum]RRJ98142.1 CDP-diacylglycerol--glycerol-3-phosphate 3-phosphatidyltransferase [Opitutaceae bacterium TAV4]RRK02720.1 CDP-diacylglycerol--glycerol-3-phosphate 3-phosphatidyltransferase [Opitutaceae bacterium TAV3]
MLNLPNLLTLSRVPLTFIVVALMYQSWHGAATLAFVLFLGAGISDWLDGHIARKQGIVSNFGKFMDALTDKIFVIGLMVAFVAIYHNPIWIVLALITLCREFMVSGMRMLASSKGVVVAADRGGKAKTVTQLIAIGFLLAAPVISIDIARLGHWDLTEFAAWVHKVGMAGFVIGTILTVWSGYRYFRNNWALIADEPVKSSS